jgi:hypothetical protein
MMTATLGGRRMMARSRGMPILVVLLAARRGVMMMLVLVRGRAVLMRRRRRAVVVLVRRRTVLRLRLIIAVMLRSSSDLLRKRLPEITTLTLLVTLRTRTEPKQRLRLRLTNPQRTLSSTIKPRGRHRALAIQARRVLMSSRVCAMMDMQPRGLRGIRVFRRGG